MPLWETSSEEIIPLAMLQRQQAQVDVQPPTSLELAYDLLSPRPLFASRWASPVQGVVVPAGSAEPEVWVPIPTTVA